MKIFVSLVCLVLCFNLEKMQSQCNNQNDYTALRALYLSTNGDNWAHNNNWPTAAEFSSNPLPPLGTNMATWDGVGCSGGIMIVNLNFTGNNLSGTLPSELGNLNQLESFLLDHNNLIGSIPPEIGNLSQLQSLSLDNNQLSGSIPTEIGALNQLQGLSLDHNQLSGSIPLEIGNLLQLQEIRLDHNQLSGSIPLEIGNLLQLQLIRLDYNYLSGCIPEELQNICSANGDISNNPLLATQSWDNFCGFQEGMCIDCPGFTFEITGPSEVCTGGSLTLDAGSYNEYLWSTGATTQTINPSNITVSTTYTVTVTDANGCSGTDSHPISVNANPTPSITGPISVCSGGSVTLDAGTYSSYSWNTGATSQTINPSNITLNTIYTVTVTDTNGCTGTDSHTVSVNANPTPTISAPMSMCSGGSATLDAGNYSLYSWSTGATTQTINPTNITVNSTYTVTVTDANVCTGTDSHTVSVNANPTPTITGATSACIGESVTLDAGSGYATYSWSTGESTPSITVSPNGPTTYTVTVTDVNGCTGTDTHTISINPLNTYQFLGGTNQTCPGNSISISWATTGVDGVNVIYLPNGLTASFSGTSASGTITVQGTTFETGFHTITLDPQGGCPNGFIFHPLEVFDLPQVTIDAQEYSGWGFTDASVCPNSEITLTAYGGLSYQWSPSIQNGVAFTPSATDTYGVTVTDINNCTASDEVLVTVFDPIVYTFDPSNLIICQDSLITLNSPDLDNYSFVNMGPGNGLNATFDGYNTLITSPAQSTCTTCVFYLSITDGNGCLIDQRPHTLTFSKSIVQSTTQVSTQGGSDGAATVQVVNGSRPYTVRVNNGNPQIFQNSPFTIQNLTEGSYNLVVTDSDGCTTTASFEINGIDCPMTVSDSIEHIVCFGDSIGRILLTVIGNDGSVKYTWQNNLGNSNILDSLKAGIYSVTVSDDNCSIIKSYTVLQPTHPLSLNASLIHPGCRMSDGSITINPEGGWMPYDTIHPSNSMINQKAGTYPFYIIDSLGCRFDTTFALLVTLGPGDLPLFKNPPQDITISCDDAPIAGYIPALAYGYPTCGLDSVGFVSASVTKVGDLCSGQTITYVWEFTDAFEHTITDTQRVQILPAPKPTFISLPPDITISYSNLAQTLQPVALNYSNNEAGNCLIAGSVMPTIDSSGLMDCSGIVTSTWKAMFCNDMDSIIFVQNITVEKDDISAPVISCVASNENSITFGWTSVPGATGYNVEVISPSGLQGTLVLGQNQYQFSNLNTGQSVTIQVEAIIPGGCSNVTSLPHTCTALDCGPLPDVLIDIPVSFCVSDQPFTLNASQVTINPPIQNSAGSFEINGIATIQINPSQLGPGTHTLFYRLTWNSGQCSQVGARDFVIYPLPSADFSISSVYNCITDPITVTYAGNPDGTTFIWDFGNDVIGTFNGPGPHQVNWANPGNKMITLSINKNGCNSHTITKTVVIDPSLLPPIITCVDQKIDGVTFDWNPVSGANSYDISVKVVNGATLYQGNVTNTTYEVTGIQEGAQVQISVTAKSNNPCPDVTDQLTCVAESCPNAKLTIPEKNISICLSPSSTPIPLLFSISDNIPNESPTVLWSSSNTKANNAINNNAVPPIFDPLIAGVGEYFVKLSYQQKSCVWEDSIRISIKAKPVITSIVSLDSICISDTLFVNTSSNPLPQIWSSSGTILTGQSSAICKIKFSNPGMNNVQLSYSNGTCTSDTITKSIFVAPEQKTPEIKCETIGNTILFTWQDTECTKSYEVWREGEIIQSSTQNKYLASSLKKGEPIEISLITNTNCPCPIPSTTKSCTLDENEDCDITLTDDHYAVTIYQPKTFDILLNDFIPYDSFTVNILEYDDDFVKDLEFKEGLEATAYKPFFDTLTVIYEVCTPDCSECKQAKLYITNEALKDIILTNIILPNSSGNNATLRFTKDDILEDSELYIFNRNGDRIFQMKNYDNSWNADGYPGGIYFYILRYHGVDIKKTLTVMK